MPKIPTVQESIGKEVSTTLAKKLGTEVHVGQIDIRLPWRIIIDDVLIYDQQHKKMLRAGRLAAGIELLPLLEGKIRISSVQLFTTQIALYKKDAHSPINCQFVIDSLKSKDTLSHTPLDLAIASIVIRHSSIKYDRLDKPSSHNSKSFSLDHLSVNEISCNIILNALTDDSLNLQLKHFAFTEKCGLVVSDIKGILRASKQKVAITDFYIALPHSSIAIDELIAPLDKTNGYVNIIVKGKITPSDIAFLDNRLDNFRQPVSIRFHTNGIMNHLKATLHTALKDKSFDINASADIYDAQNSPHGSLTVSNADFSQGFISRLSSLFSLPSKITSSLGNVSLNGQVNISSKNNFKGKVSISTTLAGKADIKADYNDHSLSADISTPSLLLNKVTGEDKLGNIVCNLNVKVNNILNITNGIMAKGSISELSYNGYTYHNISLDGSLTGDIVSGRLDIEDPNAYLHANGTCDIVRKAISNADIKIRNLALARLNLTSILGEKPLSADINITPNSISLTSDIADFYLQGHYNLLTIPYSITNIIASHLPSVPGLPKHALTHNNFTASLVMKNITILKHLLKSDIAAPMGIILHSSIKDDNHSIDLNADIPDLTISDKHFSSTKLHLYNPAEAFNATLSTDLISEEGSVTSLALDCIGKDNSLSTRFSWNNSNSYIFKGSILSNTSFHRDILGRNEITVAIPTSSFQVGDSTWTIQAQHIKYQDKTLDINNFRVGSNSQWIYVNGILSESPRDSIVADLHNVDVRYILDLVDFHSVDFDGMASGHFAGHNILGSVSARGYLDVAQFKFENGNLGDMHIDAAYSNITKYIDIKALADDSAASGRTLINGYIIPSPGSLDLNIEAQNSRLEFMQSFCSSFMANTNLHGTGKVRLYGPFSNINLTGSLVADGAFTLAPTNCRYSIPHDTVTFIPDDILFRDIPLYDREGNMALLHGGIHHKHLTQMSYDLDATTTKFLAYDFPELKEEESFCGHAIINGDIGIHGKGNELIISADATPLSGSYLTYNAASTSSVNSGEIITWRSASELSSNSKSIGVLTPTALADDDNDSGNDRTNIHMNFQVHANNDAKLHLIMDPIAGDYIDLFGNGDLRAEYFNKGGFNLFGNYEVDNGTYKMTLQNIIRRDFSFRKGGTITFGGDPYDAIINMNAVYKLNSVSLTDLNIGTNFSSINVPVNCLMNITGTPGKPKIAFSVELPSLSLDARQMVNSVINSEEEMNQQVLYLLAIGRFYAPSSTSALASTSTSEVSQSTLAVQSFLSGTLSQSFNNMMSNVMSGIMRSGNNISFGANIAPGNEGFNNAEYEGLLSGNFFNNRLLFTGQFGYRDRVATNTSSFIGDFSLQYLLTKNGVISLKVYNQSNDRYFTKNALNTQGIGVVFQKEWGK